jgi:hypothetical protein
VQLSCGYSPNTRVKCNSIAVVYLLAVIRKNRKLKMNLKSWFILFTAIILNHPIQAQYFMSVSDFTETFADTSLPNQLICRNDIGEKLLAGYHKNAQLKVFMKDGTFKTIFSNSVKLLDGKVGATEITKFWQNKIPCEIALDDIDSIPIRKMWITWSTPYYDMDSLKAVHVSKMDSLENDYKSKNRCILKLIPRNESQHDTISILENACYNLKMGNDQEINHGVIRSISSDSIEISSSFNPGQIPVAARETTFQYLIRDIKEINLLKGGGIGTKTISVDDYVVRIEESPKDFRYAPCWFSISRIEGAINFYRLLLTENGFKGIRYENGKYYWFEG